MLEIEDLSIGIATPRGIVLAVEGFSLTVGSGEVVGLVGESGSGKTLVSLAAMGLLPPAARVLQGRIRLGGEDILSASPKALQRLRGGGMSMIFQDPMASLDPVFTCGQQLVEAALLHGKVSRREARTRAAGLLRRVRIPDPDRCMASYPHELSGGMCQRVMIAMALINTPRLIIADEPTTALDVTVQREVLDLLRELHRESGTALLLITHDLGVVYEVAHRVVVMYAGRIMEQAPVSPLFRSPLCPYTQALIDSMPSLGVHGQRLAAIPGVVPSLGEWPQGCRFSNRCAHSGPPCVAAEPPLAPVPTLDPAMRVRCCKAGLVA